MTLSFSVCHLVKRKEDFGKKHRSKWTNMSRWSLWQKSSLCWSDTWILWWKSNRSNNNSTEKKLFHHLKTHNRTSSNNFEVCGHKFGSLGKDPECSTSSSHDTKSKTKRVRPRNNCLLTCVKEAGMSKKCSGCGEIFYLLWWLDKAQEMPHWT